MIRSLEYIAMAKHEMIPMCERIANELEKAGDYEGRRVADLQSEDITKLNAITKDCLAVLATEPVRGWNDDGFKNTFIICSM